MAESSLKYDSTCWTLIRGAAAGRESDRELFVRQYVTAVRPYFRHRWRDSVLIHHADDAVQDVFLECFREGGVFDRIRDAPPRSFRAFLYGVTRNVALRYERKNGRRPRGGVADDEFASNDATLSRVFDRAWARALVREAGRLHEERAREKGGAAGKRVELLRLRARENLPVREIARLWGIETPRVHKEYARARREFRDAIESVIAFHHPGLTSLEIETKCVEVLQLLGA